jgi:preprotein translocase subunit SecG
MYQFILLIHVFAAVCIIALVLVQQGKGATMGAAFGSGASQTVFGSRGSGSFLFRVTISLVVVFFATSIGLNYVAVHAYKQEKVLSLPVLPAPAGTINKSPVQSPALPVEIPTKK